MAQFVFLHFLWHPVPPTELSDSVLACRPVVASLKICSFLKPGRSRSRATAFVLSLFGQAAKSNPWLGSDRPSSHLFWPTPGHFFEVFRLRTTNSFTLIRPKSLSQCPTVIWRAKPRRPRWWALPSVSSSQRRLFSRCECTQGSLCFGWQVLMTGVFLWLWYVHNLQLPCL